MVRFIDMGSDDERDRWKEIMGRTRNFVRNRLGLTEGLPEGDDESS